MLDMRIQTFLTVCATMNYTRASEILNITQPAVSQHIRYLEQEYGCRLFSYSGKKLQLTSAGRMLQQTATAMRNDEMLLKKQILKRDAEEIPVHFGVTMTIGEYVIAKPLAKYLKEHPHADIRMTIGNTEKLIRELRSGELHFALMEGYFDRRDFDFMTYATVPFIPVCAAGHVFEKQPEKIADLLNENLLIREPGSGTRDVLEKQLAAMGMAAGDFSGHTEIGGMHAILQMLEEDAGISFLYRSAASAQIANGVLREIQLKDFDVKHDFAFIWEKGSTYTEIYRRICTEFMKNGEKTD
ncbi:MAG: LysR family transcriptional regulator [Butyrivibrio sp.]|nr:LysR family transcriptional regulator [Butyrivibrio sp.]